MTSKILRAILYARVSTDEQAEKGYSLPTQLEAMRAYAAHLGYIVVREFREDHTGMVPFAERPAGREAAAMLKAHKADAIIAYQVDRLSRDNIELLIAVRMWRLAGIEVHTVETGKIENENNILLIIKGWQASEEHGRIKERMRRGAIAKIKDGKLTAVGGHAPYGYRFDGPTFAIVAHEGRIIKLIYVWYVRGDGHGKPLASSVIARRLSEMHVKTPGESRRVRPRTRGDGIWGQAEVLHILSSEKYAGVWRYGETVAEIPAIVDRRLWDAAQARRKTNKQMAKRNGKREYLLRGLIRCAVCDKAMTGIYDKRAGNMYYRCSWNVNHHLSVEARPCKGKYINAQDVEAQAWDYTQRVIFGNDFEDALREAQAMEEEAQEPKRDELTATDEEMKEAGEEIAEIALALRKAKGSVSQHLEADQDRANARMEQLAAHREKLLAELAERQLTDERVSAILEWRKAQMPRDVLIGREHATEEDKRQMFEALQLSVTVKDGKVESMTCLVEPGAIAPKLVLRISYNLSPLGETSQGTYTVLPVMASSV